MLCQQEEKNKMGRSFCSAVDPRTAGGGDDDTGF